MTTIAKLKFDEVISSIGSLCIIFKHILPIQMSKLGNPSEMYRETC